MKKLGKFVRCNAKLFIGILIGAIIFSGVGITIAGTVASSNIEYTNNGQTNVQGALNDLYGKANELNEWKNGYYNYGYWNNNYYEENFSSTSTPNKVYSSYKSLIRIDSDAGFIRTLYNYYEPIKHDICVYEHTTSKMYCTNPSEWEEIVNASQSDLSNIATKLQNKLSSSLEITGVVCYKSIDASSKEISCDFNDGSENKYYWLIYYIGDNDIAINTGCDSCNNSGFCSVYSTGSAECNG